MAQQLDVADRHSQGKRNHHRRRQLHIPDACLADGAVGGKHAVFLRPHDVRRRNAHHHEPRRQRKHAEADVIDRAVIIESRTLCLAEKMPHHDRAHQQPENRHRNQHHRVAGKVAGVQVVHRPEPVHLQHMVNLVFPGADLQVRFAFLLRVDGNSYVSFVAFRLPGAQHLRVFRHHRRVLRQPFRGSHRPLPRNIEIEFPEKGQPAHNAYSHQRRRQAKDLFCRLSHVSFIPVSTALFVPYRFILSHPPPKSHRPAEKGFRSSAQK